MIGLMPAFIASITDDDRGARLYRIRIPGMTDGATEMPIAQLCNPIGDKSENTEIRIKVGDRVWLAFQNGDPRYPVIVGFRPKNIGNDIDWRRFEHANFEFLADNVFQVIAQTVNVVASTEAHVTTPLALIEAAMTHITGDAVIDKSLTVAGLLTFNGGMTGKGGEGGGEAMTIQGGATFRDDVTANGISVSEHTHTAQGANAVTTEPNR